MSKLVIEAGKINRQYFRDLWSYRELFLFLALRDILIRYKQTIIGIAWSVLRPLLTMIVFTIVFGRLAKMPSEGVAYPILVYAALLPWQFFSSTLNEGGNSLVNNASMISKIYFPRTDGLVPACPDLEDRVLADISWIDRDNGTGNHLSDLRPQREVP
jgi:lipopolysaccharide transport system permease protein